MRFPNPRSRDEARFNIQFPKPRSRYVGNCSVADFYPCPHCRRLLSTLPAKLQAQKSTTAHLDPVDHEYRAFHDSIRDLKDPDLNDFLDSIRVLIGLGCRLAFCHNRRESLDFNP